MKWSEGQQFVIIHPKVTNKAGAQVTMETTAGKTWRGMQTCLHGSGGKVFAQGHRDRAGFIKRRP